MNRRQSFNSDIFFPTSGIIRPELSILKTEPEEYSERSMSGFPESLDVVEDIVNPQEVSGYYSEDLNYYSQEPTHRRRSLNNNNNNIKKDDVSERDSIPLTVPSHPHHYYKPGHTDDPLKDLETNPPPISEYPPEDVILEDIMALVDPGLSAFSSGYTVYQHRLVERHHSLPTPDALQAQNPSRLHQALTQPSKPSTPVTCGRCRKELSSKCLVQSCTRYPSQETSKSQQTKCRNCGQELTAKCILSMCQAKKFELML